MKFPHGWERHLNTFVEERRRLPFAWGPNDCASFPADALARMGAPDFLDGMRGYDTAWGAMQSLEAKGYPDLITLAEARLVEIARGVAGRGDVAMIDRPDSPFHCALSLVTGAVIVGPGRAAMEVMPISAASRFFRAAG